MVKQTAIAAKIVEETSLKTNHIVAGLNIHDIVKKAQESYGKGEKGLSRQLSTGSSIIRPSKDSDFVLWEDGNFWNELTGLKGLPFGRIVQCAGRPDSGKSTMAAQFMSYAQKQGYFVILFDAEQKFQAKRYDEHMGGDSSKLLIVDTNSIIDGTKGVAYLVKTIKDQSEDAKILIVFDSIGAAINSSENNEDNEDMSRQPGAAAKEITWSIKKFSRLINQYQNRETGEHTIGVFAINQVYAKIGFMQSGYKEKGGDGITYMSSIILQMSRKKELTKIKSAKKIKFGILSRVKVSKNHMFSGQECLSEMEVVVNAEGISLAEDVKKKVTDVEGWDASDEGDE